MDNFFENIDRINEIITNGFPIETVRFEDSVAGHQLAELQALRGELEKQRKDLEKQRADDIARQKAQEELAELQAAIDRRKDRQHDYIVAVFSAVLGIAVTLIVEHFGEIISFFFH